MQRFFSSLLTFINILLLVLGISVLYLKAFEVFDLYSQQSAPEKEQMISPTELSGSGNLTGMADLRLNQIQLIATHNSYKKDITAIGSVFVSAGSSFKNAKALQYGYIPVIGQLNHGIRALEIDLRISNGKFRAIHVPLVDSRSHASDFSVALKQIRNWSESNPNHLPVMILIELKNDWMFLDPGAERFTSEKLIQLDQLIQESLGPVLYRPKDFTGGNRPVRDVVILNGWPDLSKIRGRVIFYLHPGDFTESYASLYDSGDHSMFAAVYKDDITKPYAGFVVHNEPDVDTIRKITDSGFIVRTRVDAELFRDEERAKRAFASGAQILMTDFANVRSDQIIEDPVTFEEGFVRIRE